METDPIGYADSLNLYSYTNNNPWNRVDPEGTDDFSFDTTLYFDSLDWGMDGEDASSYYYDVGNDLGEAGPYVIQESDDASNFKKDTKSASKKNKDCGGSGNNSSSSHAPPFDPWGGVGGAIVLAGFPEGAVVVGVPMGSRVGWFKGKREDTPTTNRGMFGTVRGKSGKRNKQTGEIWVKDPSRHGGDHYEVYRNTKDYERGKRDRDVWADGRSKRDF